MGSGLLRLERRTAPTRNHPAPVRRRPMEEPPGGLARCSPRVWNLDLVAGYILSWGTLVRLGPRCGGRALNTAWYCGIGALGASVRQRRCRRGTRFPRLPAAPVDGIHRPHIRRSLPASGDIWHCSRLSGHTELHRPRDVWRALHSAGSVAEELAARYDSPCLDGRSGRPVGLIAMTDFSALYAKYAPDVFRLRCIFPA